MYETKIKIHQTTFRFQHEVNNELKPLLLNCFFFSSFTAELLLHFDAENDEKYLC